MLTNEQKFLACCTSLANIEGCINLLTSIGIIVEPGTVKKENDFSNYLYSSCTGMVNVAMSYLDIGNLKESEKVYGDLLQVKPDNYLDIALEIWGKYGRK